MGPAIDTYDRPINAEVKLRGQAASFITYDSSTNSLILKGSLMKDNTTAYYHVTVGTVFIDVFGIEKYFKRDIQIVVIHLIYPKVSKDSQLYFIGEETTTSFIVFEQDAKISDESEAGKKRPKPFVTKLSDFGEITLGWSLPIVDIPDFKSVLETQKIAIPFDEAPQKYNSDWIWVTDRRVSNGI